MLHHSLSDAADAVAGDVMTRDVISVAVDASVESVAQTLFKSAVSGAPVVDGAGVPVGMVSDGDLLGRRAEEDRLDWWLALLGSRDALDDRMAPLRSRIVCDVMTSPLVSVGPLTRARDVARLLQARRIKRVPVLEDGRMIGLVGRADLLGLFEHLSTPTLDKAAGLHGLLQSLTGGGQHDHPADADAAAARAPATVITAEGFRGWVDGFRQEEVDEAVQAKHAALLEDHQMVKLVLGRHVSDAAWRQLIADAEEAAKRGGRELMLLRFPSEVCSDGGRAINIRAEGWERSLQGEAAEIYARWARDLKPGGFGLAARVLSFNAGIIGDLGLFLIWGE